MLRFLELADALRIVYEYGFELAEENFVELTHEQYVSLEENDGDISKHWFRVSRGVFEERNNPPEELTIVDEHEKARILQAVELVCKMSDKSEQTFKDFRERLAYLKDRLPPSIIGEPEPVSEPRPPGGSDVVPEPDENPRVPPRPVPGAEPRYPSLDMARNLQDKDQVEAARDLVLNFIRWQSSAEAQLEALKVLARRPTPRTLHYLEYLYKEEVHDSRDSAESSSPLVRRYTYPQAPNALLRELYHKVVVSVPGAPARSPTAVEAEHQKSVRRSEAHQILRAAIETTRKELERSAVAEGRTGFEDLFDVVRPPARPVDARPADDDAWNDVEFRLGLRLPQDFKKLVEVYGSGSWGSFLTTLNPFSLDPELNLERRVHDILRLDHGNQRAFPTEVPFPLYPERDGLFPWAFTSTGLRLYWLADENLEPDAWQILVLEGLGFLFERYQPPATDLLVRFVTGEINSRILGELRPEYRGTFCPAAVE